MPTIPYPAKRALAAIVRWPLMRLFMSVGIRLFAARHQLGVAVVVMSADGRILMLRHVFHPLTPWGLPGGWLGRRERPADCALRELREETGLTATLGPLVYMDSSPHPFHLVVGYLAWGEPGPLTLSGEILEGAWFAPDALPKPLLRVTQRIIDAAVNYQKVMNLDPGRSHE